LRVVQAVPSPCLECRFGECRFTTFKVRSYVIAYREAVKCGDDPAEYIKDCVRPSRPGPDPIDPRLRGGAPGDPFASRDIKISLEQARDRGGIALNAWNADRIAKYLCDRADELPPSVDNQDGKA
jgi:hypothetical protein